MNNNFDLVYLSGGDDVFGPDYGGATVYTNVRKGYAGECPNVGKLLSNLEFSLPMEGAIMGAIQNDGKNEKVAATEWLKANPGVVEGWMAGVKNVEGKDGLAEVKANPGLKLQHGERVSWNDRAKWPGRSALWAGTRGRRGGWGRRIVGTE